MQPYLLTVTKVIPTLAGAKVVNGVLFTSKYNLDYFFLQIQLVNERKQWCIKILCTQFQLDVVTKTTVIISGSGITNTAPIAIVT